MDRAGNLRMSTRKLGAWVIFSAMVVACGVSCSWNIWALYLLCGSLLFAYFVNIIIKSALRNLI